MAKNKISFTDMIDNAVIGAGPVGCLAALGLAQKGEGVTILEAEPRLGKRFAGEWLHPEGIAALQRAGILDDPTFQSRAVRQKGFVVFPEDGSDPILLNYPKSKRGLACEHSTLIETLRRHVDNSATTLILGAKVSKVEKERLCYRIDGSEEISLPVRRIIGADGKSSLVRSALGLPRTSRMISHMVGTVLEGLELPFEGYGHVILGAPGPILLYRISPETVRLLIDVPTGIGPTGHRNWGKLIAEHYGHFLPESVLDAFQQVAEAGSLEFRANRYRPRTDYGNERFCLVGDAVGFQHPLTAMGMTLGFQDAEELANTGSFSEFQKVRRARAFVPELLAMALYEAFTRTGSGSTEIRKAICSMWRRYPGECERTMRLLSGEVTSPVSFSCSLMRVMQLAVAGSVDSERYRPEFIQLFKTLGSIGQILQGIVLNSSSRIPRLRAAHSDMFDIVSKP